MDGWQQSDRRLKLIEELGKLPESVPSRLEGCFSHYKYAAGPGEGIYLRALDAKENVHYCKECCTLTDQDIYPICSSKRDHSTIMAVVESTRIHGLWKQENTEAFTMFCMINISDAWIGPSIRLEKIESLWTSGDVNRADRLLHNSSLEGETTAMYISKR